jgi:hypothetical protein
MELSALVREVNLLVKKAVAMPALSSMRAST